MRTKRDEKEIERKKISSKFYRHEQAGKLYAENGSRGPCYARTLTSRVQLHVLGIRYSPLEITAKKQEIECFPYSTSAQRVQWQNKQGRGEKNKC